MQQLVEVGVGDEGARYSVVGGGGQTSATTLQAMLAGIEHLVVRLTTSRMHQLQLTQDSKEVLDRLVARPQSKLGQEDKVVAGREKIGRRQRKVGEERVEVGRELGVLEAPTRKVQGQLEEGLSKLHKGRKVTIMARQRPLRSHLQAAALAAAVAGDISRQHILLPSPPLSPARCRRSSAARPCFLGKGVTELIGKLLAWQESVVGMYPRHLPPWRPARTVGR